MSTLQIYKAKNGQWSGIIIDDEGQEIGRIAGCASARDVEDEAYSLSEKIDEIELKKDA